MGKGGGRIAALVCIALLCCTAAAAADLFELHARPVIAPTSEQPDLHELFLMTGNETREGHISLASLHVRSVFGPRAALIPLWQLKGVIRADSTSISLVGRRSVYIPPTVSSPVMKTVYVQLLRRLDQEYSSDSERLE